MSTAKKLRGNSTSELTRFKALWRDELSEPERDSLRSLFLSNVSQVQIRDQLAREHGIKLHRDDQLNAFRDWELDQREMDLESERAADEERRLIEEHPDWTKDQVREDLLARLMRRARAHGDAKLGLATVAVDLKSQQVSLDREKLALLKRKADAFDRAQAALTEAKASTGGITPETLSRIERELKLL